MAAKISENVTTSHHGLAYNEHKNIISVYYNPPEQQSPLNFKNGRHCKVMCHNFAYK